MSGQADCVIIVLAQAIAATPSPTPKPDYTGIIIGAGIAFTASMLTTVASLFGSWIAHRRETKAKRIEDRRQHIDVLYATAQKAYRDCSTYRARLIRHIMRREDLPDAGALAFADDTVRIAGLHVPECEEEVSDFASAIKTYSDWALTVAMDLIKSGRDVTAINLDEATEDFRIHINPVFETLGILGNRCAELAAHLR